MLLSLQAILWWMVSATFAAAIAARGFRKRSLSKSGALAAFFTGTLHLGCGLRFAAVLLLFYLTSSKLTKVGHETKSKISAAYRESAQRSWAQVLCNSAGGSLFAAMAHLSKPAGSGPIGDGGPWQKALLAGFLGHYACCCADTWASEVGVLASEAPRLITDLRVPPPPVSPPDPSFALASGCLPPFPRNPRSLSPAALSIQRRAAIKGECLH
uniref:Transmembrane protein 19-like n=1 Tax=Tetraselmis sp. GSL018 TaxID=582737 RepID=A0A061QZK9_9CHLO|mmetsp:Transcript_27650/g.65663  ORF Transcript_27650/g.65663 Transcript_27650/m.65663 type:complete len:213 (-) Transcript_27650:241-879(-)